MIPFRVYIVSAEEELFAGLAVKLFATGMLGELEILNQHAPLLTALQPGPVWLTQVNGEQEVLYISGGVLEVVQEHQQTTDGLMDIVTVATILADTAIRAKDVDEQSALAAKQHAEEALLLHSKDFDYARAHAQLLEAAAQLRVIKKLREKLKH